MSTSHSSSSLSSATNKPHPRRVAAGLPPSKVKPVTSIVSPESELISTNQEGESIPVNDESKAEDEQRSVIETIDDTPSVESLPVGSASKREQQILDEQEYQRKLGQKIREAQQRLEVERQREEERQRLLEVEEYEREQEQIRLVEEQRRAEQERLQRAIEERERENELKRQEEQRLQQQREELERRQTEEAERLQRERQERAKREEEERNERKKRLDLIMRRTRQISPTSKVTSFILSRSIELTLNSCRTTITTRRWPIKPTDTIPHRHRLTFTLPQARSNPRSLIPCQRIVFLLPLPPMIFSFATNLSLRRSPSHRQRHRSEKMPLR